MMLLAVMLLTACSKDDEVKVQTMTQKMYATNEMISGITETTVVYPAGYLNLTKEDITKILEESM